MIIRRPPKTAPIKVRERLPDVKVKQRNVSRVARRSIGPIPKATSSVYCAYLGVTTGGNETFVPVGISSDATRARPGAAVIRLDDEFHTTWTFTAYVGNPHYLFGAAAIAIIQHFFDDEITDVSAGKDKLQAFRLQIQCEHEGTNDYIKSYISNWKANAERDGNHHANSEMWDLLNTLCGLGRVEFVGPPPAPFDGKVKSMRALATKALKTVPVLSTVQLANGYERLEVARPSRLARPWNSAIKTEVLPGRILLQRWAEHSYGAVEAKRARRDRKA